MLGRLIRLVLGGLVLFMGWGLVRNATGFWDGITWSAHTFPLLAPIALTWSWVVSELLAKRWGWWPLVVVAALLVLASGVSLGTGAGPFGPLFGIVFWAWAAAWAMLLGPALVLAAVLATPGCEMRAYAHLGTRVRGGDAELVACSGWLDRLDGVRLFGR